MNNLKQALAFFLAGSLTVAFAQGLAPKLAVYAYGSGYASIDKSFGNKLLAAMVQSGSYAEISDQESFYAGLAGNRNVGAAQVSQAAKQHGADFVFAVSLTEASGIYSIFANLIKTSDSKIIKTGSLASPIKSFDDITTASNELAKQFFVPKEVPPKIAAYAYGSGYAGIDKSFSDKLLIAMSRDSSYAEITNQESFYAGLAGNKNVDATQVSQAAKQHGADFVCAVSLTEASGVYSISANLIKTSDSKVIKTGLLNRPIKSFDDITTASNDLAKLILSPSVVSPPIAPPVAIPALLAPPPVLPPPVAPTPVLPPPSATAAAPPVAAVAPTTAPAVAKKQCAKTYNINELVFKLKDGFPIQFKDCSSKLVKDMALDAMPGFLKRSSAPTEKKDPKTFMRKCTIDGIKAELPAGFPDADKVIGMVDNYVQNILNSTTSADGGTDSKKLLLTVSTIAASINSLLNNVKKLADDNECIVDEPYMLPAAPISQVSASDSDAKSSDDLNENKSTISFGFRAGFNFSHLYADYGGKYINASGSYNDAIGLQLGSVVDIPTSSWFHIQPGLMYVQKGTENNGTSAVSHYIEIPLLLSLKFSVLRLNAGPYFGICASTNASQIFGSDFGFSMGPGFDIGMFYIGMFYDYGFINMSDRKGFSFYNRTLGLNLGVNL
jgi:hypothetical protein